jgi:hypothetical protein
MARKSLPFTALTGLVVVAIIGSVCSASSIAATAAPSIQAAAPTAAACPAFPGSAAFVSRIDNRYLPLIPGSVYTYLGQEDGEKQRTVVEVTHQTKTILGVQAVVVLDTVSNARGALIEQTFDWYAQDRAGNVWYLGEDTKEFENGQVVSTVGSWEAGVNGDQPGIIMEAQPRVGDAYNQECAPPDALDEARVDSLKAKVKTPYGDFGNALRTRETTPLEPGFAENKFYAQCVGLVHAVTVQGGHESVSLVDVRNAPSRTELGCSGNKHKHQKHKHHHHHHRH